MSPDGDIGRRRFLELSGGGLAAVSAADLLACASVPAGRGGSQPR